MDKSLSLLWVAMEVISCRLYVTLGIQVKREGFFFNGCMNSTDYTQ